MKKFSIALITTISVILSMFSVVNAATTYYFKSDNKLYSWTLNESTGEMTISSVWKLIYQTTEYSSVASKVKSINISSIGDSHNTYCKYPFSGFLSGLNNLKTITVNGSCNKLGSLKNCPALEKIIFNDNKVSSKYSKDEDYNTYLDMTSWPSSSLPQIELNNNTAYYFLDFSDFNSSKTITVPACYGKDQYITYSFKGTRITTLTFQNGTIIIPDKAFRNCTSLSSVTIPDKVKTIGELAFGDCEGLKEITIPASVTEISCTSFHNSGIKEITYKGTTDQWYTLIKKADDDGNKILHLDNATIHCSDADIFVSKNPSTGKYEYKQFIIGWYKKDGLWYYNDEKGQPITNTTKQINGEYYHFESNGVMTTGWYKEDGKWYFFNKSGKLQRGCWFQDNGNWYYSDYEGVMATGKKTIGGKYYYFSSSGAMVTGWTKIGDYWFYFETDGSMCIGWKKIDGKWFYLCELGYAPSSDNIGCMATGRRKINGKVYYFASTGVMQTGWIHIGDYWFYFGSDGSMQKDGWIKDGNDWYYLKEDGSMYCGWLKYNNNWYYLQHSGVMATKQITIEGVGYMFRSDGICENPY